MRWQKLLASRSSQKGTTSRKQISDAFDILADWTKHQLCYLFNSA